MAATILPPRCCHNSAMVEIREVSWLRSGPRRARMLEGRARVCGSNAHNAELPWRELNDPYGEQRNADWRHPRAGWRHTCDGIDMAGASAAPQVAVNGASCAGENYSSPGGRRW